jgi:hypothetical protein
MDRMNRSRAKQSGIAEVHIEFALLSSQCKTGREWETSTYMRNIGVRASNCDRHVGPEGGALVGPSEPASPSAGDGKSKRK